MYVNLFSLYIEQPNIRFYTRKRENKKEYIFSRQEQSNRAKGQLIQGSWGKPRTFNQQGEIS